MFRFLCLFEFIVWCLDSLVFIFRAVNRGSREAIFVLDESVECFCKNRDKVGVWLLASMWLAFLFSPRGDVILRGGAKRRSNLNNRGTGGKSKAPRDPQPPAAKPRVLSVGQTGASDPQPDGAEGEGEGVIQTESLRNIFSVADKPNIRMVHPFADVMSPDWLALNSTVNFDQDGSPFCGFAAIDLATGHRPDVANYQPYMVSMNPVDAGVPEQLIRFATRRGVNLMIRERVDHVLRGPIDVVRFRRVTNPAWGFVDLRMNRGGEGHYTLTCRNVQSLVALPVPKVLPYWQPSKWWFLAAVVVWFVDWKPAALLLLRWLISLEDEMWPGMVEWQTNDSDVRPVRNKRDAMEAQDLICITDFRRVLRVGGQFIISWKFRSLRVSLSRFHQAWNSAQGLWNRGIDPRKAAGDIDGLTGVNTVTKGSEIADTGEYLRHIVSWCLPACVEERRAELAFNATGHEVTIGENEQRLLEVQENGIQGGKVNHVKAYRKGVVKTNVPVAVAPIGCVEGPTGPVGPGAYPLTDYATLLAAFTVRSMTAKEKDKALVAEFVAFSREFLRPYIEGVQHMEREEEPAVAFRRLQRGKQPERLIEEIIETAELDRRGVAPKKYRQHSCFVKFENSGKMVKVGERKELRVKPRLIMVMSEKMKYECVQILDLINSWNHGPFKKFQVKDMEPEEMIEKIQSASNRKHVVSDYSSFESSVDHAIRSIENYVMLNLCRRFGYNETARALRRHAYGGRILTTKHGRFKIFSRCSGDYWTSFGNGIVNVCIMAFCAHKSGKELGRMLAEGDDGLVGAEVPDKALIEGLGFGFSSELEGAKPGDCDFLRSVWVDGKRYLNVGRCMSVFWVKNAAQLRKSKQLFLLRAAANSLYWLSPGHPVLTEVINRIRYETRSMQPFRGWQRYLDRWAGRKYAEVAKGTVMIRVDESMRSTLANPVGRKDDKGNFVENFPSVSIPAQLDLERQFREEEIVYTGQSLSKSDDYQIMCASAVLLKERESRDRGDLAVLERIFIRK